VILAMATPPKFETLSRRIAVVPAKSAQLIFSKGARCTKDAQ
jgi:hypothetical protein